MNYIDQTTQDQLSASELLSLIRKECRSDKAATELCNIYAHDAPFYETEEERKSLVCNLLETLETY